MRPSGEPLYLQIANILRGEIENNYEPGDRLEPEGKIAERFRVNRHTLRRAIDELVEQGKLERRPGVGVFVFLHPLKYELHKETRLTRNLRRMGVKGDRTFIKRQLKPASQMEAINLQIPKGRLITRLESLVYADKIPFCISTHCFTHKSHKEIYSLFETGSMHEFIKKKYNIRLRRKSSMISALLATGEDAALLRIPLNRPILLVQTVNIDVETKKSVEYVISRYRADRVDLTVNF